MRYSLFAVLSGLAALGVITAFPAENLQARVPSGDVSNILTERNIHFGSPLIPATCEPLPRVCNPRVECVVAASADLSLLIPEELERQ
ncbi:hypothetical protein OG21DRAFT_1506982 [Imleria badia]|nr:hypothetical protein OG21DRAFT_1506982 [Imleria badia]